MDFKDRHGIGIETLAPNPETSLSIRREMLRVKN